MKLKVLSIYPNPVNVEGEIIYPDEILTIAKIEQDSCGCGGDRYYFVEKPGITKGVCTKGFKGLDWFKKRADILSLENTLTMIEEAQDN